MSSTDFRCPDCGAEIEYAPFGPTVMLWCPRCTPLDCDLATITGEASEGEVFA